MHLGTVETHYTKNYVTIVQFGPTIELTVDESKIYNKLTNRWNRISMDNIYTYIYIYIYIYIMYIYIYINYVYILYINIYIYTYIYIYT